MGSKLSRPDPSPTGAGRNMAFSSSLPSSVPAKNGTDKGAATQKQQKQQRQAAKSPCSRAVSNTERVEEAVDSSRPGNALLLQPVQPCDDSPLVSEMETIRLPPTVTSVSSFDEFLATINANNHITESSTPPFIQESVLRELAEDTSQEHILAVSPQLAPIAETVEEDIAVNGTTSEQPAASLSSPPIPSCSALPETDNASETTAAFASPDPPISPEQPNTRDSPGTLSGSDIQHPPLSIPSLLSPPDPHPDSEDTGDQLSAASTNGETESVFDEDYHSDTSSYTASLLSDVKDYTYENGRRYHSYREGHYVLPNDDQEQDRQDLLHHVRNLVLNGALFRAPLNSNIQRVLDIGTGTGIWAIDFADSYPSAEVIGTDLSPIQPSWVPPNLRFLVDDAESPWLFSASRPFDFIHARDLGGAIADWPRLLRQAYGHLRPGGWIELQEFEVTLRSDDDSLRLAPTLCEFLGRLHEASEAFHRPMNIAEGHRQRLIEAGFEDVRDEVYKVRRHSCWGLIRLVLGSVGFGLHVLIIDLA